MNKLEKMRKRAAPEDAAFISPVIKDEPEEDDFDWVDRHNSELTEPSFDGGCEPFPDDSWVAGSPEPSTDEDAAFIEPVIKYEPAYICPVQECGQTGQHEHATAGGYYLPAEPSTDDRPCVHYITGDDARCIHCGEVDPPEKSDDRPWTAWPLITAGDGRTYHRAGTGSWRHIRGGSIWYDDEIAALGLVREAVVVTLPDAFPRARVGLHGEVRLLRNFVIAASPEWAKEYAAELLAAARAAESGAS